MRTELDKMTDDYRHPYEYQFEDFEYIEDTDDPDDDEWGDDWPPITDFDPVAEYKAMIAGGMPEALAAQAVDQQMMSFDDYMAHSDERGPY